MAKLIRKITLTNKDRLPAVSAAAALDELDASPAAHFLPTGIVALDRSLAGLAPVSLEAAPTPGSVNRGGVRRGVVTEVWGPPGLGKTAVG